MKAIFSLRKHSYLKTIGTFLIAIALIAGVVGCEGEGEEEFELTMAVNPPEAGTATDLTSSSPYAEGEAVDIKAVANAGYQFVEWSDTGAFADARAEETTFTMPAEDVTVTANFELAPIDHFKCYWVDPAGGPPAEIVSLEDQFVSIDAEVRYADLFCNPTEKMHGSVTTPISDPEGHLTIYDLLYEADPVSRRVEVTNQFGTQNLTVYGPVKLAVPTQKTEPGTHGADCVDFEDPTLGTVYNVGDTFTDSGVNIEVEEYYWYGGGSTTDGTATIFNTGDAGGSGQDVNCNNVNLAFDFSYPLDGLSLLYGYYGGDLNIDINGVLEKFLDFASIPSPIGGVNVVNTDFGGGKGMLTLSGTINSFAIGGQELWIDDVCPTAPYEPPVLDHYLVYEVIEGSALEPSELVILNDQFEVEPDAFVVTPRFLANPVKKTHGGEVTDILDENTHLVFYDIEVSGGNDIDNVDVEARNQFGDQNFEAFEAGFLAVPSEKTVLPPPVLNHFRGYFSDPQGEGVPTTPVVLQDQFHEEPISATVMYDWFLCNPVEKWIDEGHGSPIWHPDHHLYIYGIGDVSEECWLVEVNNQFGNQVLTVMGPAALAVPTQKEGHEPPAGLDHYLLYWVVEYETVDKGVNLRDQFIDGQEVTVTRPRFFANPVSKEHPPGTPAAEIEHDKAHLVFYDLSILGDPWSGTSVTVNDQFALQEIVPFYPGEGDAILGVPSTKLWWETYTCP